MGVMTSESKILVEKTKRKRIFGRPRRRCGNNTGMHVREEVGR
jgi:hypothetical protein